MKRKVLMALFIAVNLNVAFAAGNKRVVEFSNQEWVLNIKKSAVKKLKSVSTSQDCEEGISFVFDESTKMRYLIDKNGNVLSEKQFMHVGRFSGGKTVVSGYLEEQYETDRIYDVMTDEVSDPIPNMWVYCGFVNGLGAFSVKTEDGQLKCVLVDFDLNNVVGIEFDVFCELSRDGIWHFIKDNKDYFIDKDGKIINK